MKRICSWVEAPPTWKGHSAPPHTGAGEVRPLPALSLVSGPSWPSFLLRQAERGPPPPTAPSGAGRRTGVSWLLLGREGYACWPPSRRSLDPGVEGGVPTPPSDGAVVPCPSPACRPVVVPTIGSPLRRWRRWSGSDGAAGRCPRRGPWGAARPRGVDSGTAAAPAKREEERPGAAAGRGAAEDRRLLGACRCSACAGECTDGWGPRSLSGSPRASSGHRVTTFSKLHAPPVSREPLSWLLYEHLEFFPPLFFLTLLWGTVTLSVPVAMWQCCWLAGPDPIK